MRSRVFENGIVKVGGVRSGVRSGGSGVRRVVGWGIVIVGVKSGMGVAGEEVDILFGRGSGGRNGGGGGRDDGSGVGVRIAVGVGVSVEMRGGGAECRGHKVFIEIGNLMRDDEVDELFLFNKALVIGAILSSYCSQFHNRNGA